MPFKPLASSHHTVNLYPHTRWKLLVWAPKTGFSTERPAGPALTRRESSSRWQAEATWGLLNSTPWVESVCKLPQKVCIKAKTQLSNIFKRMKWLAISEPLKTVLGDSGSEREEDAESTLQWTFAGQSSSELYDDLLKVCKLNSVVSFRHSLMLGRENTSRNVSKEDIDVQRLAGTRSWNLRAAQHLIK